MTTAQPSGKPFDNDPLKSYGYQTRATHRAFDRALQRHIGHSLSNGFWYLLRVLWERDGMSQRELADEDAGRNTGGDHPRDRRLHESRAGAR